MCLSWSGGACTILRADQAYILAAMVESGTRAMLGKLHKRLCRSLLIISLQQDSLPELQVLYLRDKRRHKDPQVGGLEEQAWTRDGQQGSYVRLVAVGGSRDLQTPVHVAGTSECKVSVISRIVLLLRSNLRGRSTAFWSVVVV